MIISERLLSATNWDRDDSSAAWENVVDLEFTSVLPGAIAMETGRDVG